MDKLEIENKNLGEEIFCLNFELKALAEQLLRRESERWIHGYMFPETETEHLERYHFVKPFVTNKKTLDIACGSGYGTYLLATDGEAKSVLGVDLDSDAIRYGKQRYPHQNIKRISGDASTYEFNEKFESIISFETIEHIPNYKDFLQNIKSALDKNGSFIVSTPIAKETTKKPHNPYHVIEWSFDDFKILLNEYFSIEDIYLQNITKSFTTIKKLSSKRKIYNKFLNIKNTTNTNFKTDLGIKKYTSDFNFNNFETGYVICVCKLKS